MKRVKLFALISLLFIGLGHAWGAEGSITITTSTKNFPTSYGTANTFTEYTLEGYKFKVQQVYVNGTKLQWRANGNSNGTGIIYNTEAFPGKITSVVIKWDNSDTNRNHTIKKGNSANPSAGTEVEGIYNSNEGTTTYDCGGDCDYILIANGSNAGYTTSFTITWGNSVTYTEVLLQQAGTPAHPDRHCVVIPFNCPQARRLRPQYYFQQAGMPAHFGRFPLWCGLETAPPLFPAP